MDDSWVTALTLSARSDDVHDQRSARAFVAALAEPDGQDATKAADAKHVRAAATKNAKVWIRLIQAQIHNGMGEESAGTSTLVEAMELLGKCAQS